MSFSFHILECASIYHHCKQTTMNKRHAILSHCKMKKMTRYLKLHKTKTEELTHMLPTNYLTEWDITISELRVQTNTTFLLNEHLTWNQHLLWKIPCLTGMLCCWCNLLLLTLILNGQTGQCCPIKCTSFSYGWENSVPQWGFKLNSAPAAAAETRYLKCRMLKVKIHLIYLKVCHPRCVESKYNV